MSTTRVRITVVCAIVAICLRLIWLLNHEISWFDVMGIGAATMWLAYLAWSSSLPGAAPATTEDYGESQD
jgi:uncharacterized membrane protein